MKKNNRIKVVMCVIGLWISLFPISAQPPVIKAVMDSTHIFIGHQTQIHVEVAANKNQQLQIPTITDTLMNGIEVLAVSKIDTADLGNDRIQLKYHYLITSFDSALYLLPPFKAIAGADTAYSESLALNVSTLPVDTESKQFFDIKGVVQPRFVWTDYLPQIIGIILGLGLLALIVYIIYRRMNNQAIIPFLKKEEPYIPPYERAIKGLDVVKAQKLWQMGKVKEYHSDITDILRKYIDERFDVPAPEMTSGELLDKLKGYSDTDTSYDNLKQILILADFVKFAKYNPLPDENELSLMNAYLFVNHTKKEESAVEENEKKEVNEVN
ncbi:MAG: hypothetical protein LBR97_04005 [Dysgonamonadaceae bacterium]|jgi:hypothetical protein|nr:hypothetical protein [Dysgonamonadaceae bacterium]